jgi:transketolase
VNGTIAQATRSMRPVVAELIAELGERHPELVVLAADARALTMPFQRRYPRRFFDVGIAEANLVGVASGLARAGHRVVVAAMAPFLIRRAAEQLRIDVCGAALDVTLLGVGGGLSYGTLGATHHAAEDLGAAAAMPGMRVFCPADVHDAAWAVAESVTGSGPAYVRLSAREEPVVHDPAQRFHIDEPSVLGTGQDAVIIAAGATVAEALRAVEIAGPQRVTARILALTAVAPFPQAAVRRIAGGARVVITVEDHYAAGGLAAHTALALAGRWTGRLVPLAVDHRPAPVADRAGLFGFYGIDAPAIARALIGSDPLRREC